MLRILKKELNFGFRNCFFSLNLKKENFVDWKNVKIIKKEDENQSQVVINNHKLVKIFR